MKKIGRRRSARVILALTAGILLGSCTTIPVLSDAMGSAAVIIATVDRVSRHSVATSDGVLYANLEMRPDRGVVAALYADLPDMEFLRPRGSYDQGHRYAIFIGYGGQDDLSAEYAHDLATDLPARPWLDKTSYTGKPTTRILDCLVDRYGTKGDTPRLDALIQAATEWHQTGDETIDSAWGCWE